MKVLLSTPENLHGLLLLEGSARSFRQLSFGSSSIPRIQQSFHIEISFPFQLSNTAHFKEDPLLPRYSSR
ncbi:hypothetical protein V6Z12_A03G188200 [Gossypium hirsutum]